MDTQDYPPVHSCIYCRDFILDQFDLPPDQSRATIGTGRKYVSKNTFSLSDLRDRSQEGCIFFQIVLSGAPQRESSPQPSVKFCLHLLKPLRFNKYICKLEWEWEPHRESGSFQVFAMPGDAASNELRSGPPVRQRANQSKTWKKWLEECDCSHETCELATDYRPSRLLFVGSHEEEALRLVDSHPENNIRYAALSYCWGMDQTYKTTKATKSLYEQAIPPSALSTYQTITDTIHVARSLRIHYLWIDALCIIQDDPADVTRELAKMRSIYAGAYLTLTAGCTTSSRDPFLASAIPAPEYPDIQMRLRCSDGADGHICLQSQQNFVSERADDPIAARGWTLQEDLLSPRVLHFGPYSVLWRCATMIATDRSGGEPRYLQAAERQSLDVASLRQLSTQTLMARWIEIVQDYARRRLTVPADKLPALAGIADLFDQVLPLSSSPRYLAGVWAADLHAQLLWYVDAPLPRPPCGYRAPSWSWAATEGLVSFSGRYPVHVVSRLELVGCAVELEAEELPFGAVRTAVLRAEGRVRRIGWSREWRGSESGFFFRFRPDWEDPDDALNDTGLIPDSAEDKELLEQGTPEIWVLEVTTEISDSPSGPVVCLSHGLALMPAGDCFRRIGRFKHSRVVKMPEHIEQNQAVDYYSEDYNGPTAFWVDEDGDEEGHYWTEEDMKEVPWEDEDWFRDCETQVIKLV